VPKGTDPGTVTIPQYRVNKTKQHTHTHTHRDRDFPNIGSTKQSNTHTRFNKTKQYTH